MCVFKEVEFCAQIIINKAIYKKTETRQHLVVQIWGSSHFNSYSLRLA